MKMNMVFDIEMPSAPNFIKTKIGGADTSMPIENFTDEQLKEIGDRWTKELIARANSKRVK